MPRGEELHVLLERAHKNSVTVPVPEKARFVQDLLGARLAAACLGLKDTRTLQSWARGGPVKGADHEHRLQALYRVAAALNESFSPAVAAAFLRGSNPTLGDRAPMLVLADDPPVDAEQRVVAAVEALLSA